jgi:hypothetical protein
LVNPSCLFQGLIFSYNKSALSPKGIVDLTANAQRPIFASAVWLSVSMRSESDHETNALHRISFFLITNIIGAEPTTGFNPSCGFREIPRQSFSSLTVWSTARW